MVKRKKNQISLGTPSQIVSTELESLLSVFSADFIADQVKRHSGKVHAVSIKSRVVGAIHQSINIKFGNALQSILNQIVKSSRIAKLHEFSGGKVNLPICRTNERIIDSYITSRSTSTNNVKSDYLKLKRSLKKNARVSTSKRIDVDLFFLTRQGKYIYVEVKFNDDHDTGKYPDIFRKALKTGAALQNEVGKTVETFVYYFNKGERNLVKYLPKENQIYGDELFKRFKLGSYKNICFQIEKFQSIIDKKFNTLNLKGVVWKKNL